jgi:hypothetical protein
LLHLKDGSANDANANSGRTVEAKWTTNSTQGREAWWILTVSDRVSDEELSDPTGRQMIQKIPFVKDCITSNMDRNCDWRQNGRKHTTFPNMLFSGCEALFAFDNASKRCAFAADALAISKMKLLPGGEWILLRDGLDHNRSVP